MMWAAALARCGSRRGFVHPVLLPISQHAGASHEDICMHNLEAAFLQGTRADTMPCLASAQCGLQERFSTGTMRASRWEL